MQSVLESIRGEIVNLGISPWSHASAGIIRLTPITGGLTNILYKATIEGDPENNALLVRIFGQLDGLLNRMVENQVYIELSDAGISPKLVGVFPWGRLEEYLTRNFPLKSGTDMVSVTPERDCVKLIAETIAKLHQTKLKVDHAVCSADIFDVLARWLIVANKYNETIKSSPRCPSFTHPTICDFRAEIEFIKSSVQRGLLTLPIVTESPSCQALLSRVLCHNDMLSGNIMLDPETNSVRLIDFEYSGINYAAADIANVFTAVCESIMLSGEPQDVARNFPSREVQIHFLECYVGYPITSEEVEAVLVLILAFAMMDELRWTIWGVIQANQSTVDFDYIFYYNSRFDAFKCYKLLYLERLDLLRQ